FDQLPRRGGHTGSDDIGKGATERLVLRLFRELRHHPIVLDAKRGHPPCRSAPGGKRQHDIHERFGVEFEPAINFWDKMVKHTTLPDCGPYGIHWTPQLLGFPGMTFQ